MFKCPINYERGLRLFQEVREVLHEGLAARTKIDFPQWFLTPISPPSPTLKLSDCPCNTPINAKTIECR